MNKKNVALIVVMSFFLGACAPKGFTVFIPEQSVAQEKISGLGLDVSYSVFRYEHKRQKSMISLDPLKQYVFAPDEKVFFNFVVANKYNQKIIIKKNTSSSGEKSEVEVPEVEVIVVGKFSGAVVIDLPKRFSFCVVEVSVASYDNQSLALITMPITYRFREEFEED